MKLAALCLLAGCSGGGGEDRLIQRDDSQFGALEAPEADNECSDTVDCKDSCVHSCVPVPTGPMTCPIEPLPIPERLIGATCGCDQARCKWL